MSDFEIPKEWVDRGVVSEKSGVVARVDGYSMIRVLAPHPLLDEIRSTRPRMRRAYIMLHRVIAWEGGLLTDPRNVVHHHDGNRQNNDLSNLRVFSDNGRHMHTCHTDKLPTTYCHDCKEYKKTRKILDNRYCAQCYPKWKLAYQRGISANYVNPRITCSYCGRHNMPSYAKGLCCACYKRQARSGQLEHQRVTSRATIQMKEPGI